LRRLFWTGRTARYLLLAAVALGGAVAVSLDIELYKDRKVNLAVAVLGGSMVALSTVAALTVLT
jgi:hypothetical protein